MSKRGSLSAKWATPANAEAKIDSKVSRDQGGKESTDNAVRKGQTLRLSPVAWKALKMLAVEEERTSHALLIEAVNDLFKKYGRDTVA